MFLVPFDLMYILCSKFLAVGKCKMTQEKQPSVQPAETAEKSSTLHSCVLSLNTNINYTQQKIRSQTSARMDCVRPCRTCHNGLAGSLPGKC